MKNMVFLREYSFPQRIVRMFLFPRRKGKYPSRPERGALTRLRYEPTTGRNETRSVPNCNVVFLVLACLIDFSIVSRRLIFINDPLVDHSVAWLDDFGSLGNKGFHGHWIAAV